MSTKPTDTEIIGALNARRGMTMPTYYIKNVLRGAHAGLQTTWVLRRLKALEKAGLVRRTDSPYATMLCWEAGQQKGQSNGN